LVFDVESSYSGLITVTNLMGQTLIQQSEKFISGKNKLTLNVSTFSSGIYFVGIKIDNGSVYSKFIKQE
jgi:hypothetical protein